jgi:translation initiation factor 3 subunit K
MSATSEWVTPQTRPELIESLVSGVGLCESKALLQRTTSHFLLDRYNPSNVGILEDYLYHQIRSREYDCLANLAILKLYVLYMILGLIR